MEDCARVRVWARSCWVAKYLRVLRYLSPKIPGDAKEWQGEKQGGSTSWVVRQYAKLRQGHALVPGLRGAWRAMLLLFFPNAPTISRPSSFIACSKRTVTPRTRIHTEYVVFVFEESLKVTFDYFVCSCVLAGEVRKHRSLRASCVVFIFIYTHPPRIWTLHVMPAVARFPSCRHVIRHSAVRMLHASYRARSDR